MEFIKQHCLKSQPSNAWNSDPSPDGKHFDSRRNAMVHVKTNHYESQFVSGMLRACIVKIGNKVQFCHRIGFSELSLTEAMSLLMRTMPMQGSIL